MTQGVESLTGQIVDKLWDELGAVYGTRRRRKAASWVMQGVAWVLAWRGVMPQARFAQFATTLRNTVYLPEWAWVPELRDLPAEVALAVHEHVHVTQWGWRYAWRYGTSATWRARYEGEAYATNLAMWYWATGQWLDTQALADQMVRSYGGDAADGAVCYRCLEEERRTLLAGQVSSPVAALAMAWLEIHGVQGRVALKMK